MMHPQTRHIKKRKNNGIRLVLLWYHPAKFPLTELNKKTEQPGKFVRDPVAP